MRTRGRAAAKTPQGPLEKPRLLKDERTFVLLCTAGFNKSVSLKLNAEGKGFADLANTSAEPFALSFATTGAEPPLRLEDALKSAGALEALDDEVQKEGFEPLTLVPFDITDGDAVDRLGGALYARFGKLDVVVSNAGELGVVTPVGHMEPKDWDKAVAVNLTANFRLIRSMDPLLQAAEAGRAVFVTSGIASKPLAFFSAYAASKAGLDALVAAYADEVEHTKVRCALVNPGPMRTKMRAKAFPGEDPEDLTPPEAFAP